MDIHFDCPHCAQGVAIDESGAGMQVECPNCQGQLVVPERADETPTAPAASLPPITHPPPIATATSGDQYICSNESCGAALFESQLVSLEFRGKAVRVCPNCRRPVRKLTQPGNFWANVPKAFVYPFRGNGTWILVAGTPFLVLYNWLGFGLITGIAKLVLLGVFGMLLQNVIRTSADNEDAVADWPDTTEKSEFVLAGFQILAVGLLVFTPAILCLLSGAFGFGQDYLPPGIGVLLGIVFGIVGLVYFPMALLALAMFDTINVASPIVVLPAIVRTFGQYLAVIGLLAVMWAAHWLLSMLIGVVPLVWRIAALLPSEFLAFYTLMVGARLLGILYRYNASRLAWFE